MVRFVIMLIAALALTSCVTNYKEPSANEPRAVLRGSHGNCIIYCHDGVFLRAVNGQELSYFWKSNNFYVDPGKAEVLVSVTDAQLFGVCMIEIDVLSGEEYEISHEIKGSAFLVTAYNKSKAPVSTCIADMGPAPAAPTYVPIIIPTG